MALIFNAAQRAVAHESYVFWRGKGASHIQACALLGNEGGETGFLWKLVNGVPRTAVGDHGEAFGLAQWHRPRAELIHKRTGFDVINGSHLDMLNGMFLEMSEAWSAYRHVWPALLATTALWSAVSLLVVKYEQSGSQTSDDVKRTAIAAYFDHEFQDLKA